MTHEEVEQYLTALGQAVAAKTRATLTIVSRATEYGTSCCRCWRREYNPNIRQVLSDVAEVSRAEEEYLAGTGEEAGAAELQDRHRFGLNGHPEVPSAAAEAAPLRGLKPPPGFGDLEKD